MLCNSCICIIVFLWAHDVSNFRNWLGFISQSVKTATETAIFLSFMLFYLISQFMDLSTDFYLYEAGFY